MHRWANNQIIPSLLIGVGLVENCMKYGQSPVTRTVNVQRQEGETPPMPQSRQRHATRIAGSYASRQRQRLWSLNPVECSSNRHRKFVESIVIVRHNQVLPLNIFASNVRHCHAKSPPNHVNESSKWNMVLKRCRENDEEERGKGEKYD